MKAYKKENIIQKAPVEHVQIGGYARELMDRFFEERIFSEHAKNVVLGEAHDAFINCTDGDQPLGLWQGEFWGKWIISAARVYRYNGDESLKVLLHDAALKLITLQRESGYLGTYKDSMNFFPPPNERLDWNWNIWCRKYTLWGLLECYDLSKDEKILAACVRLADNLLCEIEKCGKRFGETGAFKGLPSCSILKPLLTLYRITEDERYLSFCLKFVEEWENPEWMPGIIANTLSGKPLAEWYDFNIKWAKVYEMLSCYDGLMELYRVTGEEKHLTVCEKFYELIMEHESNPLYSVGFNDEFRSALKNINGATEPCDVIHLMRLCHELFTVTGNPKYIDTFELAFYNPFLAASFKDGKWGARCVRSHGKHHVAHGQANMKYSHCCVNNMPRGYINMMETAVMTAGDSVYINLYTPFTASVAAGETNVRVAVDGEYLADSHAKITLDFDGAPCAVKLRVPAWSGKGRIDVDGKEYVADSGYFTVTPEKSHSEIEVWFDDTVRITALSAHLEDEEDPWKVRRFLEGICPPELYLREDKCILKKGAIILCRTKLIGNTEEEMFANGCISADYKAQCTKVPSAEGINVQFSLTLEHDGERFTTNVCDFASGTNFESDDFYTFSIYF